VTTAGVISPARHRPRPVVQTERCQCFIPLAAEWSQDWSDIINDLGPFLEEAKK
jgi:hypothetical protein